MTPQSDTPRTDDQFDDARNFALDFECKNPPPKEGENCCVVPVEFARTLERELNVTKSAAGLCEKHKPDGGSRNCLVCACEKLSHALSRISYICGQPNELQASDYDVHFNEDEVVKQVEAWKSLAERLAGQLQEIKTASAFYREHNVSTTGLLSEFNKLKGGK